MGLTVMVNEARKLGEEVCLVELDSKPKETNSCKTKKKLGQLFDKVNVNDYLTRNEEKNKRKLES